MSREQPIFRGGSNCCQSYRGLLGLQWPSMETLHWLLCIVSCFSVIPAIRVLSTSRLSKIIMTRLKNYIIFVHQEFGDLWRWVWSLPQRPVSTEVLAAGFHSLSEVCLLSLFAKEKGLYFDPLQVFQLFPPRTGSMDGSIQSRSRWPGQLCSLKVNKKLQIEIETNGGQVSFAVWKLKKNEKLKTLVANPNPTPRSAL